MNLEELFVGEYSVEQDAFHIEKVIEMCSINRNIIKNGIKARFLPIAIGNYAEVKEKLNEFEKEIRKED